MNSQLDCLDERVAQLAGGSTWRTLRSARDRIVEIGRELILAKEEVDHGQWLPHDKGEERPYRGAPAPA